MKIKLRLTPHHIGVGIGDKMVFGPVNSWEEDPFQELIRTFHILSFELEIEDVTKTVSKEEGLLK